MNRAKSLAMDTHIATRRALNGLPINCPDCYAAYGEANRVPVKGVIHCPNCGHRSRLLHNPVCWIGHQDEPMVRLNDGWACPICRQKKVAAFREIEKKPKVG